MGNIIFCFSSLGNSLIVARDIAKTLGDTIVLIADAMKEDHIELPFERVGIVYPAYSAGSLPPIIRRFVEKLDFSKTQYVFAVITTGIVHGESLDSLSGLIAERGGRLDAGFPVQMPSDYITMNGVWPSRPAPRPAPLQRFLRKKAKKKTAKITQSIKEKHINRTVEKSAKIAKPLTNRMSGYEKFALDYRVTDKCTGCESCSKMCPMGNITMINGRPQHGENCERCMACIQWCPVKAIKNKNVTSKRKQ